MANIQKQSGRPSMDHNFLEAVRNNEAAKFRRLLNPPEPPTPIDHRAIDMPPDREASNNDGATGEAEMPSPSDISRLLLQGVTSDGDGVLHIAARFGCYNIVEEILSNWSDAVNVAAGNKRGETALHCAASTGNVNMIIRLISFVENDREKTKQLLRRKKWNGETCLHDAVRFQRGTAVKILVHEDVRVFDGPNDSHALVKIHDKEGVSPLYLATTLRQLEIVKFLTKKKEHNGVQYPAASYFGPGRKTALHVAVLLCKDLSEHLAEWNKELIETADESESTPLHLLASTLYKADEKIDHLSVSMLTIKIASIVLKSMKSNWHRNLEGFLRSDRLLETFTMELLLKMDESAGYRADNEGSLPIHVAAASGNLDIVKLLSKCRPNCSWSCDNLGQTILHIAVKNESSGVVDYVCSGQKFARIFNTRDTSGNTALHLAVLQGDLVIFCRLMQRREICLSFTNKEERTPLDLAQLNLPSGIAALLTGPRLQILNCLEDAGADYGTYRSDRLSSSNTAKPDKDKESETISKSAALVAACAVLILTTSFVAPSAVTNYYSKTETLKLRRAAYRMFVISDAVAFGSSVAAIGCATVSGFPFLDRGTRLYVLPLGVMALGVAAMFLIFVFTTGVYVTVGPVVHIRAFVVITLLAYAAACTTFALLIAPFLMIFLPAWAIILRFGLRAVSCHYCRRALDFILPAAFRPALDHRLPRHLLPPQPRQRDRFRVRHHGGIGGLFAKVPDLLTNLQARRLARGR